MIASVGDEAGLVALLALAAQLVGARAMPVKACSGCARQAVASSVTVSTPSTSSPPSDLWDDEDWDG
ncbi:hypothetical protein GCM10009733_071500 [Nonomuraea maheshkhaliensis]|uniref:Secreted protein n=1 Tax=Nonomuraea maheshkhaliensis TaxID=419590 RepID=A0ABP4RZE6_9ACTN